MWEEKEFDSNDAYIIVLDSYVSNTLMLFILCIDRDKGIGADLYGDNYHDGQYIIDLKFK